MTSATLAAVPKYPFDKQHHDDLTLRIAITDKCPDGRWQVKNAKGKPRAMLIKVLDHMGVEMAYNEITSQYMIKGWKFGQDWVERKFDFEMNIIWQISMNYGYARTKQTRDGKATKAPSVNINVTDKEMTAACNAISHRNILNPVKDYLMSLKDRWDGKHRISTCITDAPGASLQPSDYNEWAQGEVWRSIVRFTMFPGSARHSEPILIGPPESGKSSFVQNVLPPHLRSQYFHDKFSFDWDDQKRREGMQVTLMENKEMPRSKKSWENIKSAHTDEVLRSRIIYERQVTSHFRADTIIHTTNNPKLPDFDDAIHKRFVAIRFTSSVEADKDGRTWQHWNKMVGDTGLSVRDQMFAEALNDISKCNVFEKRNGRMFCQWNSMPAHLRSPAMKRNHNCNIGVIEETNHSTLIASVKMAISIYRHLAKDKDGRGWFCGGAYDANGKLYGVTQTAIFFMSHLIDEGNSPEDAIRMMMAHEPHMPSPNAERNRERMAVLKSLYDKKNKGGLKDVRMIVHDHTDCRISAGPHLLPQEIIGVGIDVDDMFEFLKTKKQRWMYCPI